MYFVEVIHNVGKEILWFTVNIIFYFLEVLLKRSIRTLSIIQVRLYHSTMHINVSVLIVFGHAKM